MAYKPFEQLDSDLQERAQAIWRDLEDADDAFLAAQQAHHQTQLDLDAAITHRQEVQARLDALQIEFGAETASQDQWPVSAVEGDGGPQ